MSINAISKSSSNFLTGILAGVLSPCILAVFTARQLPDVGNVKQTGTFLPSDREVQTKAGFATALIIHHW